MSKIAIKTDAPANKYNNNNANKKGDTNPETLL